MNYRTRTAVALAVVAVMVLSALPLASADAEDGNATERYGATFGISMEDIDKFLVEITGKNLKELVESSAKEYMGLDVVFDAGLECKGALSRTVIESDDKMAFADRLTGYFILQYDISSSGKFPPAGTYEPKEGEDSWDFIQRVFSEEATEQHSVKSVGSIVITFDAEIDTLIDKATGEVSDVYISILPMVAIETSNNFTLEINSDDEGNVTSITIGYDESSTTSHLYSDVQIGLDIDDLKVIGEGTWKANPIITEHIYKAVVSSDMAGGLWELIKSKIGGKVKAAELIVSILGSSDKKQDVLKVVESLTNSTIHDITFSGDATITDKTDDQGNRSVVITIQRDGGTTVLEIPLGAYVFKASYILDIIPESILSESAKAIIEIGLAIIGWDQLDVADLSGDQQKQKEIDDIQEAVDRVNEWNEEYEFNLPTIYIIISAVVLIAAILVTVLMWRGRQ